jgi:membrane fusion protein (multidrug efflux system)
MQKNHLFFLGVTTCMNMFWTTRISDERNTEATSTLRAPAARRRTAQLVLLPALTVVMFSLTLVGCAQSKASIQLPPPEVLVASPIQRDVPVHSEWVATLEGYTNAEIRPQVSGYLIKQNYKEGSEVSKGQVLFEIDPRPFQANLDRAQGALAAAKGQVARSKADLARAKAQLAEAEAQLGKTTIDVNRDTPLVAQRAVAKEKLDTELQAKLAAQASVESAQAAIQSAQAAIESAQAEVKADEAGVERAELDLGWTKVTSLVNGIAGIAQVQMGNLVGPNSQLTSVSQVNPIKVSFPVSEQEYLRAKHVTGQPIELFNSSPELILGDGTVYQHKGKILLTDRQVDTATGTIRLIAAFPNPGDVLRPGGYGRVRIQTSVKKGALLVPQSAVKEIQGGYQVAVLTADKASIRPVKAGEKVGTMWVIDDGLKLTDQVVVEGIANLKDGSAVVPKPAKIRAEGL